MFLKPLPDMLEAISDKLGLYCALLEAILGYMGPSWGPLGAILDPPTTRDHPLPEPEERRYVRGGANPSPKGKKGSHTTYARRAGVVSSSSLSTAPSSPLVLLFLSLS